GVGLILLAAAGMQQGWWFRSARHPVGAGLPAKRPAR
ncbi:MAG: EamA family transporter, partial [Pseudomonas alloputida]